MPSGRRQRAERGGPGPRGRPHRHRKRFPGRMANHDVDVTIRPATVHALIGGERRGKSTLMKILYGVQKPDDGTIEVGGAERTFRTSPTRSTPGSGWSSSTSRWYARCARRRAAARHRRAGPAPSSSRSPSATAGFGLRPDVLVETLGVADRQRLEILKVLYRGATILDEPTAVLVPQEVDALFANLRDLRAHTPCSSSPTSSTAASPTTSRSCGAARRGHPCREVTGELDLAGQHGPTVVPRRITVMSSAIASTSSSLWEMKRTERPSARRSRRLPKSASTSCGTRTAVGSSRITIWAPR